MYTYHNFFGTFIILSIQAVQSIQKQYGPPCITIYLYSAILLHTVNSSIEAGLVFNF